LFQPIVLFQPTVLFQPSAVDSDAVNQIDCRDSIGLPKNFQRHSEEKVAELATFFRFPACIGKGMAGFGSELDRALCAGVLAMLGLDERTKPDSLFLSLAALRSVLPSVRT
jgi:hypothetical protein